MQICNYQFFNHSVEFFWSQTKAIGSGIHLPSVIIFINTHKEVTPSKKIYIYTKNVNTKILEIRKYGKFQLIFNKISGFNKICYFWVFGESLC